MSTVVFHIKILIIHRQVNDAFYESDNSRDVRPAEYNVQYAHPNFPQIELVYAETAQEKRPKTSKTSIAPKSTHMQQLKGKYENAYNKWTDDDEALLKRYHSEGKTNAEISGLLRRNTGAVRSRLKKLGLTGNNGAQTDSGNENSGKVASSKP